jgi:hypothetical protein
MPGCKETMQKYNHIIKGKNGIILGSQTPWAEGQLIAAGANHVTTIEYMTLTTDHPKLSTLHPSVAAKMFLDGTWEPMDFAFSYSSFEHDG